MVDNRAKPSPAAEDLIAELPGGSNPFVVAAETTRMPMIFTDATHPENRLIFANDSFLGLTGYSRQAAIGRPIGEIIRSPTSSKSRSSLLSALAEGAQGSSGQTRLSLTSRA